MLLFAFLFLRYLAFPRLAATEVYAIWVKPNIEELQAIYAPLRWPTCAPAFVLTTRQTYIISAVTTSRPLRIITDALSPHQLQVFPPSRRCVSITRKLFGADLAYEEHRIQGVRIVVISREKLAPDQGRTSSSASGQRAAGMGTTRGNRSVYERPTVRST